MARHLNSLCFLSQSTPISVYYAHTHTQPYTAIWQYFTYSTHIHRGGCGAEPWTTIQSSCYGVCILAVGEWSGSFVSHWLSTLNCKHIHTVLLYFTHKHGQPPDTQIFPHGCVYTVYGHMRYCILIHTNSPTSMSCIHNTLHRYSTGIIPPYKSIPIINYATHPTLHELSLLTSSSSLFKLMMMNITTYIHTRAPLSHENKPEPKQHSLYMY